jgi:hypothetical protein
VNIGSSEARRRQQVEGDEDETVEEMEASVSFKKVTGKEFSLFYEPAY